MQMKVRLHNASTHFVARSALSQSVMFSRFAIRNET